MNMFSVGKISKYWLILFKMEVKKIILFDPMTGKKVNILLQPNPYLSHNVNINICKCW
jgi:hypothetical protein